MKLVIVEKNGWSKSIEIDRAIIRVGSSPANDIQLQAPAIAPVHIQILYSTETASSCKVVNLAQEITVCVAHEMRQLRSYGSINIHDGDEILLGDYSITFGLPLSANVLQAATRIKAGLTFADATLRPSLATTGVLTIHNIGEQSACQFRVDVTGLPADCYQIDPIPLMYAGAQEEVRIRIFHRLLYPLAGLQTIIVQVSAPESYPGEELLIRQALYVSPVFNHILEVSDDLSAAANPQEKPKNLNTVAVTPLIVESNALSNRFGEAQTMDVPSQEEAVDTTTQGQATSVTPRSMPDLSKLKVVRGPVDPDTFWDQN